MQLNRALCYDSFRNITSFILGAFLPHPSELRRDESGMKGVANV